MSFGRYLRRRGCTWVFRFRWPRRLADCGISGELVLSLRTSDYTLAVNRARKLRLEVESVMREFTPSMSRAEIEGLVRGWIDRCTWRREIHLADTGGYQVLDRHEAEAMDPQVARELEGLLRFCGGLHAGDEKKAIHGALAAPGGDLDQFREIIDTAAWDMDLELDRRTPEGRLLSRTILRGYSTLLDELNDTVRGIPKLIAAGLPKPAEPEFPFLQHWDAFEEWKLNEKQWKRDMAANARSSRNLFEGFHPGLTMHALTAGSASADFRADVLKLPKYYDKDKRWRALPVAEIVHASAKTAGLPRVSPVTANKPLFWVPLLGRTCGARQDEICSANVGDIEIPETEHGPIPVLKIRDSKDTGSDRDIPIPKLLLDLGFLEYRFYGRVPDEPLFPELIPQGPEPRRSTAFTGRFTQYRRAAGCYEAKIDFHSFRGNVETDLKNAGGVDQAWIDEIIGHDVHYPPIRGQSLYQRD